MIIITERYLALNLILNVILRARYNTSAVEARLVAKIMQT